MTRADLTWADLTGADLTPGRRTGPDRAKRVAGPAGL
ncbi:pentapeptide repeat-containing protein [Streptomyces collinus]